ncbi:hypothetical protein Bca4012_030427 [Brassica carinata]|uniref:Uncharacterized protein n=3 Tax=Brassica TaxID=3705 RepID=A0A8X7UQR2_BRACI|nr:hypothetical protein Bca52824_048279 [Brassica carinata]CAF1834525.1 unnamed protein product [Brassica napus]VDD08400.1 unnamed protein product [Brassica oleracea]
MASTSIYSSMWTRQTNVQECGSPDFLATTSLLRLYHTTPSQTSTFFTDSALWPSHPFPHCRNYCAKVWARQICSLLRRHRCVSITLRRVKHQWSSQIWLTV